MKKNNIQFSSVRARYHKSAIKMVYAQLSESRQDDWKQLMTMMLKKTH